MFPSIFDLIVSIKTKSKSFVGLHFQQPLESINFELKFVKKTHKKALARLSQLCSRTRLEIISLLLFCFRSCFLLPGIQTKFVIANKLCLDFRVYLLLGSGVLPGGGF